MLDELVRLHLQCASWAIAGTGPHLVVPWFGVLAVLEPVADRVVMFECDGTENLVCERTKRWRR
jgi:hypothetical protein